jgi:putative membrane protein
LEDGAAALLVAIVVPSIGNLVRGSMPFIGAIRGGITMMWWYGPGMGGWGMALMSVGMILFWALIILALLAVVRYLQSAGDRSREVRATPEELLAERFARGEIDEQEYRRRLDTLHGESGSKIRS